MVLYYMTTFTKQIPMQRKVQAPNEVIETRLESKKKNR